MDDKPSEEGARRAFRRFMPGKDPEHVSFAGALDGRRLYEAWYLDKDKDEYFVSFVTHEPAAGYGFIDSISELIHQTAANRTVLENQAQLARDRRLRLWVASLAFLLSLTTLIFIGVLKGEGAGATTVIAAMVGVVASGAVFFFGIWVPAGIRSPIVRPGSGEEPETPP